MSLCRTNESVVRLHGLRVHTPQPDDPPPTEPGEPDVPPIGDPPPEPGEAPRSVARRYRGCATGAPSRANAHDFYVLVTRRSKFLPMIRDVGCQTMKTSPCGDGLPLEGSK